MTRIGRLEMVDGKKVLTIPPDPRMARIEAQVGELAQRMALGPAYAVTPMVSSYLEARVDADQSERAAAIAAASAEKARAARDEMTRRLEEETQRETAAMSAIQKAIADGFAAVVEAIKAINPVINLPAPLVTQGAPIPIPAPHVTVNAVSGESRVVAEVRYEPRPTRIAEIKNPDGSVSKITVKEVVS